MEFPFTTKLSIRETATTLNLPARPNPSGGAVRDRFDLHRGIRVEASPSSTLIHNRFCLISMFAQGTISHYGWLPGKHCLTSMALITSFYFRNDRTINYRTQVECGWTYDQSGRSPASTLETSSTYVLHAQPAKSFSLTRTAHANCSSTRKPRRSPTDTQEESCEVAASAHFEAQATATARPAVPAGTMTLLMEQAARRSSSTLTPRLRQRQLARQLAAPTRDQAARHPRRSGAPNAAAGSHLLWVKRPQTGSATLTSC